MAAPESKPPEILGKSPPIRLLQKRLAAAAAADAVVLLSGPVGSGKELAARVLHNLSARRNGPFVIVPCSALAPALAESELFGHEKGAFTGAVTSHAGLAERASGGTLLLSEVGELPAAAQAKLLRFVEDGVVTPLGGEPRRVDARLVASTSKDLAALVRAGSFREDLYYRLRVLRIDVPPLAERGEDVLLLAEHFLDIFAAELGRQRPRLDGGAREALLSYPWPGNVRELANVLRSALVFGRGESLSAADLELPRSSAAAPCGGRPAGLRAVVARVVRETEEAMIREALARSAGNRTRAARELGLTRRGLQLKMRRYGIR